MTDKQGHPSEDPGRGAIAHAEDRRRTPDTWGGEAPAYPWGDVTNGGVSGGLTKRELFAAMAMQGMLSNAHVENSGQKVAEASVMVADKLLQELAK